MLISCFDLFTFWYLCRGAGLADLYSWLTGNPVHRSLGQREGAREGKLFNTQRSRRQEMLYLVSSRLQQ